MLVITSDEVSEVPKIFRYFTERKVHGKEKIVNKKDCVLHIWINNILVIFLVVRKCRVMSVVCIIKKPLTG